MTPTHARFGITEPDFDKVGVHLVATLTELGVSDGIIADIDGALGSAETQIVGVTAA
jgi:hypothetical protein